VTQDEIDTMWQKAMRQSIKEGEMFTRYQFAQLVADKATEEANARANASWTLMCKKMVALEREACAKLCEQCDEEGEGPDTWDWHSKDYAAAIRARGEQA
jgi:hypothetical protein